MSSKARRLIILLILAGICLSGCVGDESLKRGIHYASEGDWDRSVQALQEAYNKNPEDGEIRLHLLRAKRQASLYHQARGQGALMKDRFEEAIREFQLSIALDPTNTKAEALIGETKARKDSAYYTKKGENLLKTQKYLQAREAFQKALELFPENERARKALDNYRKEEKPPLKYHLKVKTDAPISLKFKNTPIINVFEVLSRMTGVNFIFDKDVKETAVTFFITDVSFDQFMDIFLRTNNLTAKPVNEKTLIIYPDTPQKAQDYKDLQVQTFYLANMDVKKAVALLTKILKCKDIYANEKMNAVVIRGSREMMDVASRVLEANDRTPSEIMLNVEILEVSRTKERQLGMDFNPTSISLEFSKSVKSFDRDIFGNPIDWGGGDVKGFTTVTLATLGEVGSENLLLSLPTATLNFLKQDGDTKTLANPQVRVKNGEKAKIHIGERVPLRTNRRVDTTGAVTTDFQYQDVGVKVDVEPAINFHEDISLKLTLEVSSLGANVGTADDPQFSIKTRKAESVLSFREGETVIIGGLINDEERKTVRKIPLLGDIPALGYLFSSQELDDVKTDILMAITPVIIRGPEIPSPDLARIWTGKERDFSLQEPYESSAEREEAFSDRPRKDVVTGPEGGEEKGPSQKGNPAKGFQSSPPPAKKGMPLSRGRAEDPLKSPPKALPERGKPPNKEPGKALPPDYTISGGRPAAGPSQSVADRKESLSHIWPASLPYAVHVCSYVRRADAEGEVRKLIRENYEAFTLSRYVTVKGRTYHRVFVGKFKDFESARIYCETLRGKGGFRDDIRVAPRRWALGG